MAPLTIAIIGAGPGGLSAALCLRNAGHKVDVYERAPAVRPHGFRLALGPNAWRALDSVGVKYSALPVQELEKEVWQNGTTLEHMKVEPFDYVRPRYGYHWGFLERPALQNEMLRLAEDTPEGKQKIGIHFSSDVVDVDVEKGEVVLKEGEVKKVDMIIIANGVHSKQAVKLIDGDLPPLNYGRTVYRISVPAEDVKKDEEVWNHYKNVSPDTVSTFAVPGARPALFMSSRDPWKGTFGGLLMSPNMTAIEGSVSNYNLVVDEKAAAKFVPDFHPMIQRLVSMSKGTTVWTTAYRESLDHMARGSTIGIGDAVHPHLPHHGQGATQAIEDAASLGPFLDASDPDLTPETLPERLRQWEQFRKPRSRMVHLLSIRWPKPLEEILPDIRKVYDGPLPAHNQDHSEVMWDFLFSYDVVGEAKKAFEANMAKTR